MSMLSCDDLLRPRRLWSRAEILARPSPVPKAPGVYAWYFRNLDTLIPTTDYHAAGDFRLLYISISPSAPWTCEYFESIQLLLYYRNTA